MTLKERQDEVIDEFGVFSDWMEKYNYLIELSKEVPDIQTKHKTQEYLIDGCQSKVWLFADYVDGVMKFSADSDAIITKGIIALLIRVLDGLTPEEVMNADLYFIKEIGLQENLSPTRSNGLLAMMKQMKLYAMAYNAREKGA